MGCAWPAELVIAFWFVLLPRPLAHFPIPQIFDSGLVFIDRRRANR